MDVPYSNRHVVATPFGSTVPLSVAVVAVTDVADAVTTDGAAAVAAPTVVTSAIASAAQRVRTSLIDSNVPLDR